ncbi:MAG: dTDP-4-dehydrorhamnose 3,5-epimerase [Thermodesulfobacteriota bacterium]|nr:dTDP-4-dehydrorhamnose 3,5-epimerase [Thermodesulfobacteriota bacterium]
MKILATELEEVFTVEPDVFTDTRGFFMETYHHKRYAGLGLKEIFVQDNLSYSVRGTLRGLHYQYPHGQTKLVQAISGEIYDVALDIRRGSPNFGRWVGAPLSDKNRRQLYIPEGFAHGYCVLSETAIVMYKCSRFYAPDHEKGILWNDPGLGIAWKVDDPLLSDKDGQSPCLSDVDPESLPLYKPGR